ncbi:unnamed protein product [Amoebophrya sp. A120]|nr:unnamed protein product [Amoebophrya sp. A120]|eukprot:GSA120T00008412001.1
MPPATQNKVLDDGREDARPSSLPVAASPSPSSDEVLATSSTKNVSSTWFLGVLAAFLAGLAYATQTTLIGETKKQNITYDSQIMVLAAELVKLMTSLVLGVRMELRGFRGRKHKTSETGGPATARPRMETDTASTSSFAGTVEMLPSTSKEVGVDEKQQKSTSTTSSSTSAPAFLHGRNKWFFQELLILLPAACYTVQNNLIFLTLSKGYLDPPHYQLFCNAKIAITSILYRVVMRKALTVIQWCALGLLTVGMLVCALPDDDRTSGEADLASRSSSTTGTSESSKDNTNFLFGILCVAGISCCSGVAGVTNEFLLKTADNMHFANAKMYIAGIIVSIVLYHVEGHSRTSNQRSRSTEKSYFFSITTETTTSSFIENLHTFSHQLFLDSNTRLLLLACLLSQAFLGMCISFIFKFGNVILKIYQASLTTLLTTVLAVVLQDFRISKPFALGYVILLFSTFFFYGDPLVLHKRDHEVFSSICCSSPGRAGGSDMNEKDSHSTSKKRKQA